MDLVKTEPGWTCGQPVVSGKFLAVNGRRFLVKGVSYGTFAPDAHGQQFPALTQIGRDFAAMARAGINTVRVYTVPPLALMDEAARHDLRVMVGFPWSQHVAFLDDARLTRTIRRDAAAHVRELSGHPASLLFALGNEIPPHVVRWFGRRRVERFLSELAADVKAAAPEALLTYVNYPPTEYLESDAFDVCAFNVYLHREPDLRGYLARLQQIAGNRPLLLAEAGADSIREGTAGQAQLTAMHLRAAFEEGLCGAVAFAWTDEWWRGGHDVDDWAFGLVDRQREDKPALAAVADVFAEAPFSRDVQRSWPKVSVVVCAYNAADTIDDCLRSLQALTYPDFEVVVVNDGSRDATGEIARGYPNVRVIDVPNGGLSAARNIGLSEAKGEIVAYTDADVRVDPAWLSYLIQPFLTSNVAGSGGPNVVPADDPLVAQCVARSPGGPTHVLLTDRIAEHVPGCNMAFRRDALLAIGGFNPVYLRAGDDVDVCWRLQAKGQTIGFAPSALVWHHHRGSVKAYWRQQVGYGEGETWLDAHHPEKFVRGNMIWRGRIYSPLPFLRSLAGRRINTGVWGTAAFPSVYSTDMHASQYLPHSPAWLAGAALSLVAGALALFAPYAGVALLLMLCGGAGLSITIGRCLMFGWRSDLSQLGPSIGRAARTRCRLLIAWLHFVQPLARFYGRLRGAMSPPTSIEPERVTRLPWKASIRPVHDALTAASLLAGAGNEERFWGETWTSPETLLKEMTGLLRAVRPTRTVDVDDGWRADRDVSLGLGRWGWLDLRVLVEEHGGSRVLLRVGTRLRPALRGVILALLMAVGTVIMTSAVMALRWPWVSAECALAALAILGRVLWQTRTVAAVAREATGRAATAAGMIPIGAASGAAMVSRRFDLRPASMRQVGQAVIATVIVASAAVTGTSIVGDFAARSKARPPRDAVAPPAMPGAFGALAVAPNGDLFVADLRRSVIRRFGNRNLDRPVHTSDRIPAADRQPVGTSMYFEHAADVAVASNGDVYVADARNGRICRIDGTGRMITVAGSGEQSYDGDGRQATQAALHAPNAVAVALNGDLYIADTLNNRIRRVAHSTGVIETIAGDGTPGEAGDVGDGGLAVKAHLNRPTDVAVAANGDIYIADMGDNRIRRIDARTTLIDTVAGNGIYGAGGDDGPAVRASLASPVGLALVPGVRSVTIYIADYHNSRIRVVRPDGTIATVGGTRRFDTPARVAYGPGGWLYVASETGQITAVNLAADRPRQVAAATHRLRRAT